MSGHGYGSRLFDQHQAKLASSAISIEVARERGYVTADTKAGLHRHGFSHAQCEVISEGNQALVIPLHDVFGELAGHQMRPDAPRTLKEGKPAKYETQAGQRMLLDVPLRVRAHLSDPARPLFITEGPLKADAMVSAGLDTIALMGVWNWRGTNDAGGKVALADWEQIALEGRQVYVVFDSDAMLKKGVHDACGRLGAFLKLKMAKVAYVYLPAELGQKIGADDFLAAGHTGADIVALAAPELRKLPSDNGGGVSEPTDNHDDLPDEPGHVVLDAVHSWLTAHVAYAQSHHSVAVTLWAAHTHATDKAASSPRLAFTSPEPESGKTRSLELLEPLVHRGRLVLQMSPASVYRWVETYKPTILLDEVDAVFGPKASKDHEDLRALVNAGHRPGATVPRVETPSMKVVEFACYCPVALAGLGALPDTIRSRSITIPMRRRAPDETVRPYRERITRPEGDVLRRRLDAWLKRHGDDVPEAPELPEGVTDRQADQWEPLVAIADAAGGHWPETARQACTAFVTEARTNTDDQSLGIRLLGDIHTVFGDADRLTTADLLDKLTAIDEAPWGDLRGKAITARWLAQKLKSYNIRPGDHRFDIGIRKGYLAEDFHDAWVRYQIVSPPMGNKGNKGNAPGRDVAHVADVAHKSEGNGMQGYDDELIGDDR